MSETINRDDLISRADAVKTTIRMCAQICDATNDLVAEINALPSAELTLQTPQTYGKSINPSNAEVVEDYISRADAIEAVDTEIRCTDKEDDVSGLTLALSLIFALPSAEAVSMEEHVKELNDLASAWKNKFVNAEKRTKELYDETMEKVANECKTCKERLQNLRPSAEAVTHGRLIDADALSEKLCETTIFIKDGEVFQRMINDAPTVLAEAVQGDYRIEPNKIYCSPQVAENVEVVVRCKDCKYCEWDKDGGWCKLSANRKKTMDFCSDGERKGGDTE